MRPAPSLLVLPVYGNRYQKCMRPEQSPPAGDVASALPSISVRRLSAILCPRARSGMLCLWDWTVLEKFTRASDRLSPRSSTIKNGCQRGGTSLEKSPGKPRRLVRSNRVCFFVNSFLSAAVRVILYFASEVQQQGLKYADLTFARCGGTRLIPVVQQDAYPFIPPDNCQEEDWQVQAPLFRPLHPRWCKCTLRPASA